MGFSHGKEWNDEKIEKAIKEVMKLAKIETFPTHSLMDKVTGNTSLSNVISKHGGTAYWAKKLNLETLRCESKFGYEFECECMNLLISKFGYDCELTKVRYPYDVIVNNNIKIDVKSSHLYSCRNGCFYTFNLEKEKPTCDIFVCYCVKDEQIAKVYVIPSCVTSGKTQLSIGENHSKYDTYKNDWHIVEVYNEFYEKLKQCKI